MKTQVTFRHTSSSHPKLHDEALSVLGGFSKFSDDIIAANVEFINDTNKIVEIAVHLTGNTIVAKEESDDFQKSLRDAADKIVRQIRKHKTKQIASRTKEIPEVE